MPSLTDPQQDNTFMVVTFGVILVSVIIISIGMNSNMTGNGVTVGCIVLACGLALFSIGLGMNVMRLKQTIVDDVNLSVSRIYLLIITLINVAFLVWFIYIISDKQTVLANIEIINYMRSYLQMFLFTVTGIIFINMSILYGLININDNKKPRGGLFSDNSINMFFSFAETIILAMYIYIIYIIVFRYAADG